MDSTTPTAHPRGRARLSSADATLPPSRYAGGLGALFLLRFGSPPDRGGRGRSPSSSGRVRSGRTPAPGSSGCAAGRPTLGIPGSTADTRSLVPPPGVASAGGPAAPLRSGSDSHNPIPAETTAPATHVFRLRNPSDIFTVPLSVRLHAVVGPGGSPLGASLWLTEPSGGRTSVSGDTCLTPVIGRARPSSGSRSTAPYVTFASQVGVRQLRKRSSGPASLGASHASQVTPVAVRAGGCVGARARYACGRGSARGPRGDPGYSPFGFVRPASLRGPSDVLTCPQRSSLGRRMALE